MRLYTLGALCGLVALVMSPASAQVTVYQNDFQGGSTAGFSSSSISATPGTVAHAADKFLGEFNKDTVTLSLSGLASHTTATVDFDLYMIRSMDGDGQFGAGADPWSLAVSGGSTLLNTNFANYPGNTQMFQSQANPNAGSQAPQTGSTQQNSLGYLFNGTPMDAVYHFSYTFNTAASSLGLVFTGNPNEDISNESWGLDNVVVKTNANPTATPEPGSIALAATFGITGIGFLRRRNRRK